MREKWTLMASHGTVLFFLATHPSATIREISTAMNLTDRRVSQIIHDLADSEVLLIERRGRRNLYEVNPESTFHNPVRELRMSVVMTLIRDAEAVRSGA
jgi:DNA-binding MarR family transcriptional regulator